MSHGLVQYTVFSYLVNFQFNCITTNNNSYTNTFVKKVWNQSEQKRNITKTKPEEGNNSKKPLWNPSNLFD